MPGSTNNSFEVSYLYCTDLVLPRKELIRVNFFKIIVTTYTHAPYPYLLPRKMVSSLKKRWKFTSICMSFTKGYKDLQINICNFFRNNPLAGENKKPENMFFFFFLIFYWAKVYMNQLVNLRKLYKEQKQNRTTKKKSELSIFRQKLGKVSVDLAEKTKATNLFIEKPLKETNFDLNQSPLPKINYKMISELTESLFLVLRNKQKILIYRQKAIHHSYI